MKHIDLITAKVIDGDIDVESLSDQEKTLVIDRLYILAGSLQDTKFEKLGETMLDIMDDMVAPPEFIGEWQDDLDMEETILEAESKGSIYLPPDKYVLQ